jgi:hypothetical protein
MQLKKNTANVDPAGGLCQLRAVGKNPSPAFRPEINAPQYPIKEYRMQPGDVLDIKVPS